MATDTALKIRENRLRRMADRQGLAFHRTRRRDRLALDYGTYYLTRGRRVVTDNLNLDGIEAYLHGKDDR